MGKNVTNQAQADERAKDAAEARVDESLRLSKLAQRTAKLRALRLASEGETVTAPPRPKAASPVRRSKLVGK